jgi:hypothetical protein
MGREMLAIVPMVPLAERQSMCVGIMSYNGQLNFGLIGDYDSMPDLESIGLDLEAAMAELSAAVPKRKRAARKTPQRAPAKKSAAKAKGNGAKKTAAKASGRSGSGAKA